MAYTRGAKRRSLSRKRSYARRVRRSHCRGKGPAACRGTSGCKYSSGRKRSFCRKNKNTKRRLGMPASDPFNPRYLLASL